MFQSKSEFKMKKLLLSICIFVLSVLGYGQVLTFISQDNIPISKVECIGLTESNDSIGLWLSNSNGVVRINKEGVDKIVASHANYSDKMVFLKGREENSIIVLHPVVELNEIVVRPKDVEEFKTYTSYYLAEEEMDKYANVYQALNEIPSLTILPNGAAFYQGDSNIKILIDGVDATIPELQSISKEDIAKVNVYRNPPLRFLAQGVAAVIDIKLKLKIHGGNGAINISQSFRPLKGENSAALFYNYKQARLSVLYSYENKHYSKFRQSEVLDYEFDMVKYKKVKDGLDSRTHEDENTIDVSCQINKPDNYLYNLRGKIGFDRNGNNLLQNVHVNDETFFALNNFRTEYTRYVIGNYFEKKLGDRGGTFLANANYQHFNTQYSSSYNEMSNSDFALNDSYSFYKTRLDGVFGEIQYQSQEYKIGTFFAVAYGNFQRSKYNDATNPFYQSAAIFGGQLQWYGYYKNIIWYALMGLNWHRTSNSNDNERTLLVPTPTINADWKLREKTWLSLKYTYGGSTPDISQLSETNQWLDTRLVYHGNSELKPYKTHNLSISFILQRKYFDLSLKNFFESSPDRICDMYKWTNDYMLQTLVNLNKYNIFTSQLDFNVKFFGDNKLIWWNRLIYAHLSGENQTYSWNSNRIQWMSSIYLGLSKWIMSLFYQYPGKVVEGQLIRPRSQVWSITALYHPFSNLSIGIEWKLPFGKGLKESEYTVDGAPVFSSTEILVKDWSNLVSFKLSYNFSFGRNKNRARPQYDNISDDSGILIK